MLETHFYQRSLDHMAATGFEAFDLVGFIPHMLSEGNPDDAVTQLNNGYAHGGGWHDFPGFTFVDGPTPSLTYPGDPPMLAVASWQLRDERIILFDSAWVAVVQPNGDFRVARMD